MPLRDVSKITRDQSYLARQLAAWAEKEVDRPTLASPEADVMGQVVCRLGDASCAGAHASRLSRVAAAQPVHDAVSLLNLQRSYGNRYVQRVVALARQADSEAEVAPEVEDAIQAARGGGQALDSDVRARMEPAFGADFSGVRVHADAQADILNRALNARAFTTGQDIFFKQAEYSPDSSTGRELLAHELTHVIQQNDGIRRKLRLGQPEDDYEREADQQAAITMRRLQRQTDEDKTEEELAQTKATSELVQHLRRRSTASGC